MIKNNYGIWIGENSTIAIIDEYRISFLRVKKDLLIATLWHNTYGAVSVVYGFGINYDAHAAVSFMNPNTKDIFNTSGEAAMYIHNHSADKIEYNDEKLIYTMYDGSRFELLLAEKIDMSIFDKVNEVDNSLPVTKKMALWEVCKAFEISDYVNVRIDTEKYSILYSFSLSKKDEWVYCRVGQNGYCEKGRAMLSTVCIRQNEVRMIEDNTSSINDYKPNEDWFITDGCSFPEDGGWYWSIKEITDDVIYLQGCGGDTYRICRV